MENLDIVVQEKQEKKIFRQRMLGIAVPIVLSNLVSQIEMLVDRMFLGKLDITCMSAVGNASSPIWTTVNLSFCLAVGSNVLISQSIGAKDNEKAKTLTASLFKYSNILAILLFLVWMFLPRQVFTLMNVDPSIIDMSIDYARYISPMFLILGLNGAISCLLQVSEKTNIMIAYGIIRSLTNLVLDYGLIFGNFGLPRMEVAGAALATAIAEYVGFIIVVIYVLLNKEIWLKPTLKETLKAKWLPYKDSIKKGLPAAIEDFMWNIGSLYLIVMLNTISPEAAGIYTIVFSVELLPVCLYSAVGNAALTLSGQEAGKGKPEKIKRLVRIGLAWTFELGVIMLTLFGVLPKQIISLFTTDINVINTSTIYLFIVGIDLFPKAMNIVIGSGIRGYGDTKWMLYTQIFGTIFVIGLSTILVLVFHQGIGALFLLVVADETLRGFINLWKLFRISKPIKA